MVRKRAPRPAEAPQPPPSAAPRRWPAALGLAAALFAVYQVNGDVLIGNDAKPNLYLPATLLAEGRMVFRPRSESFMFDWALDGPHGRWEGQMRRWGDVAAPDELDRQFAAGKLVARPKYYLVPTVRAGEYVDTFGPGAGLAALPLFALIHAFRGGLLESPQLLWRAGKAAASALVAASAALVFLTALAFTTRRRALAVAAAYGLGTCVFSTSSQALWQHGPTEFFLALGVFFLCAAPRGRAATFCGAALAAAVATRPTSGVVLAVVGLWLLWPAAAALARREDLREAARPALEFALGAAPILMLLAAYNAHYLGAPWRFGQTSVDPGLVRFKTGGSDDLWGTPPWLGAAGLLLSPSRGLLTHSPFLALAFWGAARAFREQRFAALRPVALSALALWLIAFCWYDWWGGWSFGYRPIVDTMPLLAVLLVPVVDAVFERRPALLAAAGLLAWSVTVQWAGAFAYDVRGWNAQGGRDVDLPEHRARLWSIPDSQVLYYLRNYSESRRRKQADAQEWVDDPAG